MSGLDPDFLSVMFFSLTAKAPATPEQLKGGFEPCSPVGHCPDSLKKLAPEVVWNGKWEHEQRLQPFY